MSNRFEDLPIYKESHKLVLQIYKITKQFPEDEKFSLTSQLRRSAASIPANIVDENSRNHKKEFLQFLYIALGSLEKTKYHLLLSKDLGYIGDKSYMDLHFLAELVGKQLRGLIKYCGSSKKYFFMV